MIINLLVEFIVKKDKFYKDKVIKIYMHISHITQHYEYAVKNFQWWNRIWKISCLVWPKPVISLSSLKFMVNMIWISKRCRRILKLVWHIRHFVILKNKWTKFNSIMTLFKATGTKKTKKLTLKTKIPAILETEFTQGKLGLIIVEVWCVLLYLLVVLLRD